MSHAAAVTLPARRGRARAASARRSACSRQSSSCSPCSGGLGALPLDLDVDSGWTWPFAVNDTSMPHIWTIAAGALAARAGEPAGADHDPLPRSALHREGGIAGFALGARDRLRDRDRARRTRACCTRGFLPYIVASQTIPILAIAPMVVVWVNPKLPAGLQGWGSVAVIAAYLTFFPGRDQHAARPAVGRRARSSS